VLVQHIRTKQTSLIGRDHLTWQGYFVPVRSMIDGPSQGVRKTAARQAEFDSGGAGQSVREALKMLKQLHVTTSGF
jgi:splicing factor 3B subunit 3